MSSRPHTVGFECELHSVRSHQLVDGLTRSGLWTPPPEDDPHVQHAGHGVHYNHCRCSSCSWDGAWVRPHSDSSCGGELVTKPMAWPGDDALCVMTTIEQLLANVHAEPGRSAGFHIHVGLPPYQIRKIRNDHSRVRYGTDRWFTRVIDYFSWYEHQFAVFARQSAPQVRRYNYWLSTGDNQTHNNHTPVEPNPPVRKRDGHAYYKGYNLSLRTNTLEFRMWNSVVDAWRMHMAIEISCAFLDAVSDAPDMDYPNTPRHSPPLLDFLAPHMSDEAYGYAVRHLATHPTLEVT